MKRLLSYADLFRDWKQLLKAVEMQPDLADLKVKPKLEAVLAQAEEANARQLDHTAAKQVASKELKGFAGQGRDLARELRAEVSARLGSRSEQLAQFRVKPVGRVSRKSKSTPAPQEGDPGSNPTPSPTPPPTGVTVEPSKN
jgi:ABC-type transporter Mla subunit MlaD